MRTPSLQLLQLSVTPPGSPARRLDDELRWLLAGLDLGEDVLQPGAVGHDRGVRPGSLPCSARGSRPRTWPALVRGDHEVVAGLATSDRPSTSTGVDGGASLTCSPWSLMRPGHDPGGRPRAGHRRAACRAGPGRRPRGPAMSRWASRTTPRPGLRAGPQVLHLRHDQQVLQHSSMPMFCRAEISQTMVSPPQDSARARARRAGSAPLGVGVLPVDLVTATTIGTSAARRAGWPRWSGHDAVVRGHHQDHDVRGVGAAARWR